MNKTLIITLAALAASFSVYAGVELRSSFVDKTHNTFIVEVVDTETNEVIESRTFQYDDAGDAFLVARSSIPSQEEVEVLEEAIVVATTSGFGLDLPSVEASSSELGFSSDDSNPLKKEVGVWDAVKLKLEASQAALSKALEKLQEQYASLGSDQPAEEKVYQEFLHVEKVAHETETTVVVDGSEASENQEPVLEQEAEVSLPK